MNIEILEKIYPFALFDDTGNCLGAKEMSWEDMKALSTMLEKYKPMSILEIGAWTGSVTCLFGLFLKEHGGKLHTIDNFKGSPDSLQVDKGHLAKKKFLNNIKEFGLEGTVTFLEGNSDDFKDLDMKFDMVFVDADHRYSQVKKDLDHFYPKVRDGGIMAGHDFNSNKYDERYVERDFVGGVHHGVTKAVVQKFKGKEVAIHLNKERTKIISSVWYLKK